MRPHLPSTVRDPPGHEAVKGGFQYGEVAWVSTAAQAAERRTSLAGTGSGTGGRGSRPLNDVCSTPVGNAATTRGRP